MLEWTDANGHRFSISIDGYEFPEAEEDYDANWLIVSISLTDGLGEWSERSPCLLAWELGWLCRWLEGVISGDAPTEELEFMEPDITFAHRGGDGEQHQLEAAAHTWPDGEHVPRTVSVTLSRSEIEASLTYLKKKSEEFPPRGEQGEQGKLLPGPGSLDDEFPLG